MCLQGKIGPSMERSGGTFPIAYTKERKEYCSSNVCRSLEIWHVQTTRKDFPLIILTYFRLKLLALGINKCG